MGGEISWFGYSEQEVMDMGHHLLETVVHHDDLYLIEQHHDRCRTLNLGEKKELWFRLWHKEKNDKPLFTRTIDKCVQLDETGLCLVIEGEQHEVTPFHFDGRKIIERALKFNAFELWYQPIIHLKTEKVVGYEALSRIVFNDLPIQPYRFIPYIVGSDLEYSWLNEQINEVIATLRSVDGFISLNLSDHILDDKCFIDLLQNLQCDRSRFMFEVVEDAFGTNRQLQNLNIIKRLGHRLEADDVPEKSTIPLLLKTKNKFFYAIKIDRSVCDGVSTNTIQSGVAKMLIDLAKKQGLIVIAEGLEKKRDVMLMRRLGADYGQGFYFSKPLPLATILENQREDNG